MDALTLHVLEEMLAVCRLPVGESIPAWAWHGGLVSVTRTADELSIVCAAEAVPPGVRAEQPWRALRVAGQLDFALTGILVRIAAPLAEAGISIFALSTFDTDYVLVRAADLDRAVAALAGAGHRIERVQQKEDRA